MSNLDNNYRTFEKKIDKIHQRLILPRYFTKIYGDYYKLKVYSDKIEVIPSNEENFQSKKK